MIDIILSLIACLLFGIAMSLQKIYIDTMSSFSLHALLKNRKWVFAVLLNLVGGLFYLYALKLSPITTVQPIASSAFIIPILTGIFFLKEKLEVWKWIFMLMIITGVILVSVF